MTRRSFLALPIVLLATRAVRAQIPDVAAADRARILRAADAYLREAPITVTATRSPRSAGGVHDYFSEGDYWWPDPANPDGPYIQRDGMTNPDNFTAHRAALMRLSVHVPALAAASTVTREPRYAEHARRHLRAWFIDVDTLMQPHLLYSQAIKGRFTGRGIGIIDTVHLVEVVRAVTVLEQASLIPAAERDALKDWFARYLTWMTTHQYGIDEREAKNNHGTCWAMQVAQFARYVGRTDLIAFCRDRYRTVLLPNQAASDGSFPEELRRTKPYGYSLFNLDAMAMVCQILSAPDDNLWTYELPDGRGMPKAMAFMVPFIADKRRWPHTPDVMYFDEWPVRHPSLLFAGIALNEPEYLKLWRSLNPDPTVEEVIRNYFIRQPVLWL
jgi:Alginate lyase